MTEKALRVLEFNKILSQLADYALTDLGNKEFLPAADERFSDLGKCLEALRRQQQAAVPDIVLSELAATTLNDKK